MGMRPNLMVKKHLIRNWYEGGAYLKKLGSANTGRE